MRLLRRRLFTCPAVALFFAFCLIRSCRPRHRMPGCRLFWRHPLRRRPLRPGPRRGCCLSRRSSSLDRLDSHQRHRAGSVRNPAGIRHEPRPILARVCGICAGPRASAIAVHGGLSHEVPSPHRRSQAGHDDPSMQPSSRSARAVSATTAYCKNTAYLQGDFSLKSPICGIYHINYL